MIWRLEREGDVSQFNGVRLAGIDSRDPKSHSGRFLETRYVTDTRLQLVIQFTYLIGIFTQIESRVVDHVSLLHNIRTHREIAGRCVLADCLKTGIVIGVGGGSEALKHALLSEKERANVDGEDGALFGGILLLELDVLGEEIEGLRVVLEDLEDALTAGDDDDIEVLNLVVRILIVHIGLDGEALDGGHCG